MQHGLAQEDAEENYVQIAKLLATKSKKEQTRYWKQHDPKGKIKPVFDQVIARRSAARAAQEGGQEMGHGMEMMQMEEGEAHYYEVADALAKKSEAERKK